MLFASATLLKIFGVDEGRAPDDAELEFSFTHLPHSWAVFLFIGGGIFLVWLSFRLYRREKSDAGRFSRIALATVRSFIFLLLLFVLLGPSLTYTQSHSLRPVIAVLRDASRSMQEKDDFRDEKARKAASALVPDPAIVSRSKILDEALLGDDARFLRAVSSKGRLRLLDFGSTVRDSPPAVAPKGEEENPAPETAREEFPLPAPLDASAPVTDLAAAIEEGMRDKLTSAIFLATDGQHNSSSSIDDAVAEAAKRGIPVFVTGLGDPVKPQNVTVAELYADPQTWKDDPFEVQAKIFARGLAGEPATAQLVLFPDPEESGDIDPLEDGIVLEETNIDLPEDGAPLPLVFTHTPNDPGTMFLSIRILPLDRESNEEDNAPQQPVPVEVLDDKARVLLIAGSANWEYRALMRFLMREETIDLAAWLQDIHEEMPQRGNTQLTSLPANREDLFAYDVIILLDPSPQDFSSEWMDLLYEFVDGHSGGLAYMPGPIHSGSFLRDARTSGITKILPVDLGDVGDMEVAALLATNTREWPLQIVTANLDHPVMRFFPEREENEQIWNQMPGVYWSFPARASRPGARRLIEHSDPALRVDDTARPLVVSGFLGGGRTVFLGIDGSWRWRTAGEDSEYFNRFWVQNIRYLAEGRALAGKRRGSIDSARTRYIVGDRVQLTARLRQSTFEPWMAEEVTGLLTRPGEDPTEIKFTPVPNEAGIYQATVSTEAAGEYKVAITLEDGEGFTVDTRFRAELPIRETRDTWLDRELLERIARDTNGAYFEINQLDKLAEALPNRIRRLETRSQPIPLWDTNRVLFLLVGLLGLEWALRKKLKML